MQHRAELILLKAFLRGFLTAVIGAGIPVTIITAGVFGVSHLRSALLISALLSTLAGLGLLMWRFFQMRSDARPQGCRRR